DKSLGFLTWLRSRKTLPYPYIFRTTPIRADYVTFLQLQERILHLEFQTVLASTPPLALRMLDYWVRLYRLYRLPITQVVVLLLPSAPETIIEIFLQCRNNSL
ncbi:hypothetical protein ABN584_27780, partial [Gloeocapsa sp. BRSZ]